MALLEVRNLSKSYPQRTGFFGAVEEKPVVQNVSFSVQRGDTLGLVGESGSGKSTIARMVLGLIPPTSGEVIFDGQSITGASRAELRRLRRRIQPVFQDPMAALNPRMTIAAILEEPWKIHGEDSRQIDRRKPARPDGSPFGSEAGRLAELEQGPGEPERSGQRQDARSLLQAVGLDESALLRYPHQFSGGQRQRINIARALALRPELLVLDEPVSALDVSVGAQIINLLRQLQQTYGLTYLFISHSMPLVRYLSTGIAVLKAGRLVEQGESEALCRHPQEAYTRGLLQATPRLPGQQ